MRDRSISMCRVGSQAMPALIHTCYRIGEIDRSVRFYETLGFEERGRFPIRDEAINVFMGLPGDDPRLELTYNHGVDAYELGTGYNHIAVAVEDHHELREADEDEDEPGVDAVCARVHEPTVAAACGPTGFG